MSAATRFAIHAFCGLTLSGGMLAAGQTARAADGATDTAVGSNDKIMLKDLERRGDQVQQDRYFSASLAMKAKVSGRELQVGMAGATKQTRFLEDNVVLSDNSPTVLRRKYTVAWESDIAPDGTKKTVASYQGKTVTLKRFGSKTIVSVDEGKLSDAERKDLEGELEGSDDSPYPDHPVGPGDEWDLDSKKAGKMLGHADASNIPPSGHFKFLDYTMYEGRKCARLQVKLAFRDKSEPASMTMDLEGTCYYAVDLQHTVAIDVTGPAALHGKEKDGDQEVEISGTGKANIKISYRFLKQAGHPVKPPAATPGPQ